MDPDSTQPAYFIGKYQLLEEMPRGGMAQVYRAHDPDLGLVVAVKILSDELAADEEARARFLEEARTAATLNHENIVRVFYCGEHEGRPYMVMEFLEGEDLNGAIRAGRTGSVRDKLYIAWQTAKALEYVHERQLIHRDIKPHNVHIDNEGKIRVLDFGIAKRPDLARSLPGTKIGSPHYMSPEQTRGEKVSTATDIWSFGVTLYQMFTADIPFSGDTPFDVAQQIVEAPTQIEPLREAKVPEDVEKLICDCLAKNPADRPTATELREDLEDLLDAGADTAVEEAPPSRSGRAPRRRTGEDDRKPLKIALAAVAALVVILAGWWFFGRGEPEPAGPLTLASSNLPVGVEGQDYSGAISVTGGSPPLEWSVEQGNLPDGVTLRDGQVQGVPSGPGSYSFLVRIVDRSGESIEQEFRIDVRPTGGGRTPVIITGSPLPAGSTGVNYQQPLTAAGGQPPFGWSVAEGALPSGLDVMGDSLFGTPTSAGNYQFTLRATDGSGVSSEKQFELRIRQRAASAPPKGRTTTPPKTTPVKTQLSARIQTTTGEMVLVPSGAFLSGSGRQSVSVPAFYIDRTEVTQEAYAKFCQATGASMPRGSEDRSPSMPAVHVTLGDAAAFAKWAGKRLPTRREWEKAARGTDGRIYPWGNQPASNLANVVTDPSAGPGNLIAANSLSGGASPYGVLQILGNAWEYVEERTKPSAEALQFFQQTLKPPATAAEPWYVICGGSYNEPLFAAHSCSEVPARYGWYNIGFRCVKDAK